jgi:hypothetical protein
MKSAPSISFLDTLEEEKINLINIFFEEQANRRARIFRVEASQLAQSTKIPYQTALSILVLLRMYKLAEQKIVVYHSCDDFFTPADYIPLSMGFPQMPWTCPLCDDDVEDERELLYEFTFIFEDSVRFPLENSGLL